MRNQLSCKQKAIVAWDDWVPVNRGDLRKLERRMAEQQTQINAIVEELGQVKVALVATQTDVQELSDGVTALETATTALQTEVAALQTQVAAGNPVDLTALAAAADDLVSAVGTLKTSADAAVAKLPVVTPPVVPVT
jgi:septal ring factor EnvC (AmiA/AmiB activator)